MPPVPPCDPDLFDLLVCPLSRAPLKWSGGKLVSTDRATRRAYRIEGDVPIMLIDQAEELSTVDWERLMAGDGPVGQGSEAVRLRHGRA